MAVQSFRRNRRIRVPEVRLIDENGEQAGVVSTKDALQRAQEAGLDLVEVAVGKKETKFLISFKGDEEEDGQKRMEAAKRQWDSFSKSAEEGVPPVEGQ